MASDKDKDLAILSIKGGLLPNPKYRILKETQKTGTSIWLLGYPLTSTMGNEIKATSGIISSRSGYKGDEVLYQISAPIQPGNSGGPVFDLSGNVVGIVCAHHTQTENVSYVNKQPTSINVENKTLPELIEQSKSYVFHIICTNK
jgi:S1-C subfamily serine protease